MTASFCLTDPIPNIDTKSQCRISNTDDWKNFAGLPLTGSIEMNDGKSAVVVSEFRADDKRGKYSYYAATSIERNKAVVFLFVVEANGLLLQAVKNNADAPVTNGMCASTPSSCDRTQHAGLFCRSTWVAATHVAAYP